MEYYERTQPYDYWYYSFENSKETYTDYVLHYAQFNYITLFYQSQSVGNWNLGIFFDKINTHLESEWLEILIGEYGQTLLSMPMRGCKVSSHY